MDQNVSEALDQDASLSSPAIMTEESTKDGIEDTKPKPVGLKRVPPYWHPYSTMAKGRWFNREILELVSTEFRDRSIEYYRFALESGVTTVNGRIAKPGTIVRNGDRIQNMVHRHEPPVTSTPVKILKREQDYIVIDKPGSIPIHATGRYYKQSLVYILRQDLGFQKIHTINRLDRLTSGLMIIPLDTELARKLGNEFLQGKVQKEYIARCKGEFPGDEVICDQPLLTVDRQMGLNIVHPQGKPAKTIFNRMLYDAKTNTSVLHCRPLTGRSHQIRVHLQYLGHSIANDPIYSEKKIWGERIGSGGIDITPSDERAPPVAPEVLREVFPSTQSLGHVSPAGPHVHNSESSPSASIPKLLPRESGHDIGMGSPVPLSAEAVGVITRLRNMKDEDEDWSRWRDVVFRAKGVLNLRAQNNIEEGGDKGGHEVEGAETATIGGGSTAEAESKLDAGFRSSPFQLESDPDPSTWTATTESGTIYCTECYLPLHPDPKPERLYIYLHALRYTTSLGCFETELPEWAKKNWTWED